MPANDGRGSRQAGARQHSQQVWVSCSGGESRVMTQNRALEIHRAEPVPSGLHLGVGEAFRNQGRALWQAPEDSQFHALAEFMPQMVWVTDERGWAFWYNRRWYDYTGTTLEEMQGFGWFNTVHPEHVSRVREGFDRAWKAGSPWEDTYPLRRADGTYRWFLGRALPLRDPEGRITRWFGTDT